MRLIGPIPPRPPANYQWQKSQKKRRPMKSAFFWYLTSFMMWHLAGVVTVMVGCRFVRHEGGEPPSPNLADVGLFAMFIVFSVGGFLTFRAAKATEDHS